MIFIDIHHALSRTIGFRQISMSYYILHLSTVTWCIVEYVKYRRSSSSGATEFAELYWLFLRYTDAPAKMALEPFITYICEVVLFANLYSIT